MNSLKFSEAQISKSQILFNFIGEAVEVEIHTERLLIRSYKLEDFEKSLSLYGNASLVQFFDHGKPRSKEEVEILINQSTLYFAKGEPFGLFTVISKDTGCFLGHIDVFPGTDPSICEIGYIFDENHHGQGYCTEAVKNLIFAYLITLNKKASLFLNSPISEVIATVHPKNVASRKILEKVGMTFVKSQNRFDNPRLWYSLKL